jgi:TolB-like protein
LQTKTPRPFHQADEAPVKGGFGSPSRDSQLWFLWLPDGFLNVEMTRGPPSDPWPSSPSITSPATPQEYFADGMTDELITMLAKDSTLRITSRTSVMQYKGAHRPLPEIARALNVDGILEGSISRTPDKVHLTLQLIRADTDTHLWAESYDRDANDVVSLPQEAALTIAKRLNSAATPTAAPRYVNPEAHDAYLHGHYLWYADQNEKSFEYFKKATELQPDYAPGWAGLSDYYGAGMVDGLLDPATSRTPEEGAAIKAVQLDDSLPEAHLALCAAYLVVHWDWTRSDPECQRAIQLDPEFAEAHHFRAKIFAALNRHPEAIEEQKKSRRNRSLRPALGSRLLVPARASIRCRPHRSPPAPRDSAQRQRPPLDSL